MSERLKDKIDLANIKKLAFLLHQQKNDFDIYAFQSMVLTQTWPSLSLKQRIRTVTKALKAGLLKVPIYDYEACLNLLEPISKQFSGLFHLVFSDYVECYGLEHFERSMQALALFTQGSTAEYAIRAFLKRQPESTKAQMLIWADSDNEHLRRLASEGVRPKLPWSDHLPWIAKNPDWVKPIIEKLKSDSCLYVRKSVANLLNDLTKERAEWVLRLFTEWTGGHSVTTLSGMVSGRLSEETGWIMKHALRTLLKQGDPHALALIGYPSIEHLSLLNWQLDKEVALGDKLNFSFELHSNVPDRSLGLLRVEYALYFLRKRSQPYRKVFKIAEAHCAVLQKTYNKTHNFKPISTRTYHPGVHQIEVIVNGQLLHEASFNLMSNGELK